MLPALFAVGLLLMPVGLWLRRRRPRAAAAGAQAWPTIDLNVPHTRHTVLFFAASTFVGLVALSFASQRAVEYSESQQFCGQTCHQVMGPHYDGAQERASRSCELCGVSRRAGRAGIFQGEAARHQPAAAGDYQSFSATGAVAAGRRTAQRVHVVRTVSLPDRFIGDVVKVVYEFADDEANSKTMSTLRLHVGGPVAGTGRGTGIHWHMNRSNVVEYVATDEKLEQIPYVRVSAPDGQVREYFAEGASASDLQGRPTRRMGCIDCHNRPAHTFGSAPERAVDAAMGAGLISAEIPFIRREAVRALRVEYPDQDTALTGIERSIRGAIDSGKSRRGCVTAGCCRVAGDLPCEHLSVDEDYVGDVSGSGWPHDVSGLFPLPRRLACDERGESARSGLRDVSLD